MISAIKEQFMQSPNIERKVLYIIGQLENLFQLETNPELTAFFVEINHFFSQVEKEHKRTLYNALNHLSSILICHPNMGYSEDDRQNPVPLVVNQSTATFSLFYTLVKPLLAEFGPIAYIENYNSSSSESDAPTSPEASKSGSLSSSGEQSFFARPVGMQRTVTQFNLRLSSESDSD